MPNSSPATMPERATPASVGSVLCAEDQLWQGLEFPVMDSEEMPAQHTSGGDQVHFHRGVWWKSLNRFFVMPCQTFTQVDPRESWPDPRYARAGYMHLVPDGVEGNATYPAIVNDDVKNYSVKRLASKRKSGMIRAATAEVTVRPVSADELIRHGQPVYISWHERVGWGRDRSGDAFAAWVQQVCSNPKQMVLAAFVGENMAAFTLPYATGHVVAPSFLASHTDYLTHRPNDVLYHAILCIARQTPGITLADFGPVCSKESLNEFKLRFGRLREFPAYARVHPLLRMFAAEKMRVRYPWLVVKGMEARR